MLCDAIFALYSRGYNVWLYLAYLYDPVDVYYSDEYLSSIESGESMQRRVW
jgi:hypothetical protein